MLFQMEIGAPPHPPSLPPPHCIKHRFQLCIYFPLTNQMRFFFLACCVFSSSPCTGYTAGRSGLARHCAAAVQRGAPPSHHNKASVSLGEQRGSRRRRSAQPHLHTAATHTAALPTFSPNSAITACLMEKGGSIWLNVKVTGVLWSESRISH